MHGGRHRAARPGGCFGPHLGQIRPAKRGRVNRVQKSGQFGFHLSGTVVHYPEQKYRKVDDTRGLFPPARPKQALPKALPCWLAHPGGDALDELGQLFHLPLEFSLQRGKKLR